MYQRCYNEKHQSYSLYGGYGVSVCDEWKTLNGFFSSVDKVDGWDINEYLKGNLSLDKDFKIKGNKVYSPETCIFMPMSKNRSFMPHTMKEVIGVSPEGNIYHFYNKEQFARDNGLVAPDISLCVHGRISHHHYWRFYFADGTTPYTEPPKVIIGTDPHGNVYRFLNASKFSREHELDSRRVNACVHGKRKTHRGWTFKYM